MDLNYLYHRHQVSLYMSENARSENARIAHAALAAAYLAKIDHSRRPAHEGVRATPPTARRDAPGQLRSERS